MQLPHDMQKYYCMRYITYTNNRPLLSVKGQYQLTFPLRHTAVDGTSLSIYTNHKKGYIH